MTNKRLARFQQVLDIALKAKEAGRTFTLTRAQFDEADRLVCLAEEHADSIEEQEITLQAGIALAEALTFTNGDSFAGVQHA